MGQLLADLPANRRSFSAAWELCIGFSTPAVGSAAAEVQQEAGRSVPGHALDGMEPIYGDQLDARVT